MSAAVEDVTITHKSNLFNWKNMLIAGTAFVVTQILLAQVVSGLGAILLLILALGAYASFLTALVLSVSQSKKDGTGKAIANFLIALVVAIGVLVIGGSIL